MEKDTNKKNIYIWSGTNQSKQKLDGEIEATNIKLAGLLLRRQNINIQRIKRKPSIGRFSTIKFKNIIFMSRQLATLLTSGIPLNQALSGVSSNLKTPAYKILIDSIRQSVEEGNSFSDSLKKYPRVFNPLYISMVTIGEESGTLDILMGKIASSLEKIQRIKSKIISSMLYPVLIIFISIIVIMLILLLVIPEFQKLYDQQQAQLPFITTQLITLSDWLQNNIIAVIFIYSVATFSFIQIHKKSYWLQFRVDYFLLHVPILGKMIEYAMIARITHALSIMISAGVPLITCLNITKHIANNKVFEENIHNLRKQVIAGQSLTEAMQQTKFPAIVIQMISTGEETGALDTMLDNLTRFYESEMENAITAITSLIEPILIVVVGSIIGVILLAMYMPMLTISSIF